MISNALFNESLSYLKKNGALFFEIYYDETETTFTDIFNGRAYPEKTDISRGVSLRAFDGGNHICVFTEDLTYSNLRSIVRDMAKQLSPSNNIKPLRCDTLDNFEVVSVKSDNDCTAYSKTIIEELSTKQKLQRFLCNEPQFKTRCYFQNQKVQLLSSFSGTVYDNRSKCCIKTDAVDSKTHKTNILTPTSYNELNRILQSNGLACGYQASGQELAKCPTGKFDLVLLSGSSSLFFHECCGHALEVHNAMRPDAIFYGMLGKKIANDCISLCDDGSLNNLFGSISVDDEGNPAQKNVLIRNGVLEGYFVDLIEGYKNNIKMTSTTRRQSFRKVPTARMTNTYIANGTCKEEEIIKNTKNGLLIKSFSFGNANPITGDFTVIISAGNFIKNGIIDEPFQGGRIYANALSVLSSIDMVADNLDFTNGFCLASSGRITVSGGQPTLRIANVPVFNKE